MAWLEAEKKLEEYFKRYKYNFVVQKFTDYPNIWLNYKTPEYNRFIKREQFVNHREVFKDEVIIDIDMDKDVSPSILRADAERIALDIKKRINKFKWQSKAYYSGGTGIHIHLRFKGIDQLEGFNNALIKKIIIKFLAKGYINKNSNSYGKAQLSTLPTIQLEFAPHRKGGTKTIFWDEGDEPNHVYDFLYDELKVTKENHQRFVAQLKKDLGDNKPKIIDYLESRSFANKNDGTKRALFVLTAYYKQYYDNEDVNLLLNKWNKDVLGNKLHDREIKSTLKSTKPGFLANYVNDLLDDIGIDKKQFYEA